MWLSNILWTLLALGASFENVRAREPMDAASAPSRLFVIRAQNASADKLGPALEQAGLDVAGTRDRGQSFEVIDTQRARVTLALERLPSDWQVRLISTEETAAFELPADQPTYMTYEQTLQRLSSLAEQYPSEAKLIDLSAKFGDILTHEGRRIYGLRIAKNTDADKISLAFVGLHHARELMTHHIVTDLAELLLRNSNEDPNLLTGKEIWFIPVVNPDGLSHVFSTDRMWRKNRRPNDDGSHGVDVNRNYPFKWGECGSNSSQGSSQTFKGPAPASEPETRLMDALNNEVRFEYLISFHSAGDEILYPYRCGVLAEPQIYLGIMNGLAETLGYGHRYASSSGEDFEHHYAMYGTLSFLIEVGASFQPDFSYYKEAVWPNIARTLPFMLAQMGAPATKIRVMTDHGSQLPLVTLSIEQIAFQEGERRETDRNGIFHWRLPPGTYDLTASKEGYGTVQKRFTVAESQSITDLSVTLSPQHGD